MRRLREGGRRSRGGGGPHAITHMDQRHAVAHTLGTFPRTPATPEPITDWPLTSLTETLNNPGTKFACHGHHVACLTARVAIPGQLFARTLRITPELRPPLIHRRRERTGCHALPIQPTERCALIAAKSKRSGSSGAMSRPWRTGDATFEWSALPRLQVHVGLRMICLGIWSMSGYPMLRLKT